MKQYSGRRLVLGMLPKRILSRLMGGLSKTKIPSGLRRKLYGAFARRYGVDMDELDRELEDFTSFAEFFGRPLREGARPISASEDTLVSPVDGRLVAAEDIEADRMLLVKGNPHSASELAAGLPDAERFASGQQLTLYLAPGDYHRIHAPIEGTLTHWSHVPGTLFPVNDKAFGCIPGLFARNERVSLAIDSERFGRLALIAVGAFNVGSIIVPMLPQLQSNAAGSKPSSGAFPEALPITRGQEIAKFGFGSTVVLLLEQRIALDSTLIDTQLRCGTALGRSLTS
ncbi:MAG: phosphatidylserine decarboxylase [Planctomycetota bacterium]|nr:MAG: phosphatidylserine decarboxylase [Planctomycetota bacterium]